MGAGILRRKNAMSFGFSEKSLLLARWSAILLGFSIPISVALDNLLLALILLLWLLSANFREKFSVIRANPAALLPPALFVLLVIGTLYGERNPGDSLNYLGKYSDLLFVPIFITLFQDANTRRHALFGFALSIGLILLLSHIIALGLPITIPGVHAMSTSANPVVFKLYLTHSILMSFGAFMFATLALYEKTVRKRNLYALLAALAVYNIVFMVQGRIGYLLLALLLIYFCFCRLRWKGLIAAAVLGSALFSAAYAFSPGFHQRINLAMEEYVAWNPGRAAAITSSTGLRLEFYKHSLEIIAERPLLGAGTGSFPKVYADKAAIAGIEPTKNPHNEYLLIAIQLGLVGVALLIYLFYRQWQLAAALATAQETQLARALVLTIAVGCLLNSLLLDHVEGLFYAWMSALLFAGLKWPARKLQVVNPLP